MNVIVQRLYVVCIVLLGTGVILLSLIMLADQRRIDALQPLAAKYKSICSPVKVALRGDRLLLRNIHDREILLGRFASAVGDDSYAMLSTCLPYPFPMEAWDSCIATHDDLCLEALLKRAEDAIP